MGEERLQQQRFIGIAHRHIPHHLHELILPVSVIDQQPSILFRSSQQRFFFEVTEPPVLTHWHDQIGVLAAGRNSHFGNR